MFGIWLIHSCEPLDKGRTIHFAGRGGGGGVVEGWEFVWTNNVLTKLVKDPVLFNLELTSNFEMTWKFYNLGNQQ